MPRGKKNHPCPHCDRENFKSPRALNQHIRQAHKGKARRGSKANPIPEKEVFVQKPINFCCFCGEQLPNATIIQSH